MVKIQTKFGRFPLICLFGNRLIVIPFFMVCDF